MAKSDTKVLKARLGRRLGDSSGSVSVTVIHALRDVYEDKMLKQAITSLSRWSARTVDGRGTPLLYTCSVDGVTVQGKGWQLNIGVTSSTITEKWQSESLRKIIEKFLRLQTGKKS